MGTRKNLWKVAILADIHYPKHNEAALAAVESFLPVFGPDYLIYLGDTLDCTPVSHWLHDRRRTLEGLRLSEDYAGLREMITRHKELCGRRCNVIYMEGNHETWIRDAIDREPQFEGFIELENNIGDLVSTIVPYKSYFRLGKLVFIHGYWWNKHHAYKHVSSYHRSVVYGHVHSYQAFAENTPVEDDPHIAFSIPALMDQKQAEYTLGRPTSFVQGFAVAYIHRKTGNFNVYPIVITNGKFFWNGEVYGD